MDIDLNFIPNVIAGTLRLAQFLSEIEMLNMIINFLLVLGAYFGFLTLFLLIAILRVKLNRRVHRINDTNLA